MLTESPKKLAGASDPIKPLTRHAGGNATLTSALNLANHGYVEHDLPHSES